MTTFRLVSGAIIVALLGALLGALVALQLLSAVL